MSGGQFDKRNMRSYLAELGGAIALYTVVLFAALTLLRSQPTPAYKTAIILAPMLPIGLATLAIWRSIKRMDERQRQVTLEVIALAAAGTALLSLTWGFLELAGFPRLSMFAVWLVMGALWFFIGLVMRLRRSL